MKTTEFVGIVAETKEIREQLIQQFVSEVQQKLEARECTFEDATVIHSILVQAVQAELSYALVREKIYKDALPR